jgi:hypothetical protein
MILVWLGGLSFAGWMVWIALFGFTIGHGLAMLASLLVALVGFSGLDLRRRLESLAQLGGVYLLLGMGAVFLGIIFLWDVNVRSAYVTWLCIVGSFMGIAAALIFYSRHRLMQAGMLFELGGTTSLESGFLREICERYDSLRKQPGALRNIRVEGYSVTYSAPGPPGYGTRYIGRIFLEHQSVLPFVLRAKDGSVSVYEISAYASWVQRKRKGSWQQRPYLDNPFKVPDDIEPPPPVREALLGELGEIVTQVEVISKQVKEGIVEVTPDRISVLLETLQLSREELASACNLLVQVATMIDEYMKGERD